MSILSPVSVFGHVRDTCVQHVQSTVEMVKPRIIDFFRICIQMLVSTCHVFLIPTSCCAFALTNNQVGGSRLAGRVPLLAQHTVDVSQERKKTLPQSSSTTTSGSVCCWKRKKSLLTSEDSVTCQAADPKKFGPFKRRSTSRGDFWHSAREKLQLRCGRLELALQVAPRRWPSSISSSSMNGMTGSLRGPLARIKVGEKNSFGMIEWKAVREAALRFLSRHTEAAA